MRFALRSSGLVSTLLLSCCGSSLAQALPLEPPRAVFRVESGTSYSRGNYGLAEATEVFVVPFSLVCETGPWVFRTTLPWINIMGPASGAVDGITSTGGPVRPTRASKTGLGDSTIAASYKLDTGADPLHLGLTGRLKLPTGDDSRGIGTGSVDTYAQVDVYRTFGRITPFGSVGYRWLGEGRYQLENGCYASGFLLFSMASSTSLGTSVEWRDKLVTAGDNATEGSVFVFQRFSGRWSGMLSVMKGFTDASANYGVSTQVSHTF